MWHFIWASLIRVCSFPFSIICWPEGFQRRPQHRFGCFSCGTERSKVFSIKIDVRVQFHRRPVTGPCFGQYQSGWTYEPQLFFSLLWLSQHVMFPVFFLSINLSQSMFLARDGNGKINERCWAICLTQNKRTRGCWNSLCRSKGVDNGNTERLCTVSAMYGRCNLIICCFYYQVKFWLRSAMSSFKFCKTNWIRSTKQMCSALCSRAFKDRLIKQLAGWN